MTHVEDLRGAGLKVRVKVLFPLPLDTAYDYVTTRADLVCGSFVAASFAGRRRIGVVWTGVDHEPLDVERLKPIEDVIDCQPLGKDIVDFVTWVATYTMAPLGSVLRLVIRSGAAAVPPRRIIAYRATGSPPRRMTPARALALRQAAGSALTVKAIAATAGVGEGVVRGLIRDSALLAEEIDPDSPFDEPDPHRSRAPLSREQSAAAATIRRTIETGAAGAILLDGVTGSGKTEVYLEAVATALSNDPAAQVLIMIPEIALTLPFLDRVKARFGSEPAAWHSGLGVAERRRVFRRVLDGNARIVVGARSALFLPYRRLCLIVVDEEHDASYKQEDGVIYQARDLAVARASRGKFPVILASATPSLETVVNVDSGRYRIVRLPTRFGAAQLPQIVLIDLKRDPPVPGSWLSPTLVEAISATLDRQEQALLFLNRRGYAPLTVCRRCGHRMKAPNSDTWLVEHRFEKRLVCHFTGYSMPKPEACPECHAIDALIPCGPGVERVAEAAAAIWPTARLATLSSDTIASPGALRRTLDQMRSGDIDLLVATQIVAKGHHFPRLSLVGVIDGDMGLSGGDLRAAERTFQLLSQVAGRAGREERKGTAFIQTYQPGAPVLAALAAGNRDEFLVAEAAEREALGFPPYGRLAAVMLKSADESVLKQAAEAHREALFPADGIIVWGPAPAPLYRLRGEARIRFLVKARRDVHVQGFLAEWLRAAPLKGSVRRYVDIDPYSFL